MARRRSLDVGCGRRRLRYGARYNRFDWTAQSELPRELTLNRRCFHPCCPGICRMSFDGCPPDAKYPGDDSPVVWGQCAHAFHLQCINKWCE